MKEKSKFIKILEIIAITILIASFLVLAYCIYISLEQEKVYAQEFNVERTQANVSAEQDNIIGENLDITETIEKVNNSIVGISKIKNKGNTIFLQNGAKNLGLGTGFIVSENGYIVTNQHVSGQKNSVCYVTLEDGRSFDASVVWADEDLDLSVIKIKANNLRYLDLGNSDEVKIAQQVYAIGNPIGFEFQRSVTSGIISGLNRTLKVEEEKKTYYMEDLIQTDATINPGNSGGPLIDKQGKVIGVNSVKITSAEGIGFAIPINIIKPIINKLVNTGEFTAATLGVYAYDKNVIPYINSELGSNYKLENGIYVTAVIRNSPADKAQMKVGDVIIQVDGKELSKMSELRTYIYEKNVGDSIRIKYVRNNKEFQEDIILKKNKT